MTVGNGRNGTAVQFKYPAKQNGRVHIPTFGARRQTGNCGGGVAAHIGDIALLIGPDFKRRPNYNQNDGDCY